MEKDNVHCNKNAMNVPIFPFSKHIHVNMHMVNKNKYIMQVYLDNTFTTVSSYI